MKNIKNVLIKFLVIGTSVLVVWCINNYKSAEKSIVSLGDTGITVELPSEYKFKEKTSKINDYFGQAFSGEWSIIVNHEEKDDFAGLDEYAQASAKANNAGKAKLASDGNYYFEYKNGEYHFYTAVRQNNKYYYRIAFYCFEEDWLKYKDNFEKWATTIKLEKK